MVVSAKACILTTANQKHRSPYRLICMAWLPVGIYLVSMLMLSEFEKMAEQVNRYIPPIYYEGYFPFIPAIREQYDCMNATSSCLTSLITLITDIERGCDSWSKRSPFRGSDSRSERANEVPRELSVRSNQENITKNSCRYQPTPRAGNVLKL